jgi:hypothetical protein
VGAGGGASGAGALADGVGAWSGAGAAAAGAAGGADDALFSAGGVLLHPQKTRTLSRLSNNIRWIGVASSRSELSLFGFFPPGLFMFLPPSRKGGRANLLRRILKDPRQREPFL